MSGNTFWPHPVGPIDTDKTEKRESKKKTATISDINKLLSRILGAFED